MMSSSLGRVNVQVEAGNGVSYTLLSEEETAKVKEKLQAFTKLMELEQDEDQRRMYCLQYKAEMTKELASNLAKAILSERSALAKIEALVEQQATLEIEKHKLATANQQLQERIKQQAEVEEELNALQPLVFQLNTKNKQVTESLEVEGKKRKVAEAELDQTRSILAKEAKKIRVAEEELNQTRSTLDKEVKKIRVAEEELNQTRSALDEQVIKIKALEEELIQTRAELQEAQSSLNLHTVARMSAESKLAEACTQIEGLKADKIKIIALHEETKTQLKQTKTALSKSQKALEEERAKRAELEQKIQNFINQFQPKK